MLVPLLGVRRTFLFLALITVLTGVWGLWHTRRRRALALGALLALGAMFWLDVGPLKAQPGLVYEKESTYNFIQVVETPTGVRQLLLNEGQGIHSIYAPNGELTGGTWDYFLIAPYFNPPPHAPERVDNLLVIGLAAGTIPAQYTAVYGPLPIDGVEIDPAIVAVGRKYFGMNEPNLNVITADGRFFLKQTEARYDVVAVDAYRLPYIPWHLTTVEFFREIRAHLTDEGVVAINVGHTPDDWRIVEAMVATMREVYPSVHVISVPGMFNAIVIATLLPSTPDYLAANLPLLQHKRLIAMAERARDNLITVAESDMVFTDDRAPVELLTDVLVVQYFYNTLD